MPEEGNQAGYDPREVHTPMTATEANLAKAVPRKDSEIENLLGNLEKELELLHMSSNSFIRNVSEVLSPEHEEQGNDDTMPSPSSPLGRRLFQATYQVSNARKKIDHANERVRI